MPRLTQSIPTIRIGILGGANIAKQFIRDVTPSDRVDVVAVASRTPERAATFAAANGIGRAHGSYEDLLGDEDVDVVYLPLPNSMHAEWAIKAAEHGKHVLCEKPLALDAAEAKAMFDAARRHGVMLLEAYPYYFQPQTGVLLDLLGGGAIGAVKSVHSCFGFALAKPHDNIRMKPELGGGALLDAGSHALSIVRLAMHEPPVRVSADATWADSGVDISTMATLHYADGRRAQLSCAMDTGYHRRAVIVGSQGTIEAEYLNHTSARGRRRCVRLSAERASGSSRRRQLDSVRDDAQRCRQRLSFRRRGLCQGHRRARLRGRRPRRASESGQRRNTGGDLAQRPRRVVDCGGSD